MRMLVSVVAQIVTFLIGFVVGAGAGLANSPGDTGFMWFTGLVGAGVGVFVGRRFIRFALTTESTSPTPSVQERPVPIANNDPALNPRLIPCPDCGRYVSRSAPACPQCGRPLNLPPSPPAHT